MKTTNLFTLLLIALPLMMKAQEANKTYKITKTSGKIVLSNVTKANIEGYNGNEVIITQTAPAKASKEDPRAAGLTAMSSEGFDNTGLGLSTKEKDQTLYISVIAKESQEVLNIKIPQQLALSIKSAGFGFANTKISLKGLSGEIEISSNSQGDIKFSEIKGPLSIKTMSTNVEGKLLPAIKGPISIVTLDGFIDLAINPNTKANVAISNLDGALYADKSLNLEKTESKSTALTFENFDKLKVSGIPTTITVQGKKKEGVKINSDSVFIFMREQFKELDKKIKGEDIRSINVDKSKGTVTVQGFAIGSTYNGTLNGGGEQIILKSTSGKIYLRK